MIDLDALAGGRVVDLTHPVRDGMPVFPGDPVVRFATHVEVADGGYHVTRLQLGTHSGTHVDAPRHIRDDGSGVDAFDLAACFGPARVVDVSAGPGSTITAADCDIDIGALAPGERLLLRTGWSTRFGSDDFFTAFPSLHRDLAHDLVAAGVVLVGLEQPSVSATDHLAVHATLLDAGVVLVETLAGLPQLTRSQVLLACLPLRVSGGDGAPVRALAWEPA